MLATILQKRNNNLILSKIYGASYFSLKKEVYEERFYRAFEIVKKLGLKDYFLFYLKGRYNLNVTKLNSNHSLNVEVLNQLNEEEVKALFSFFEKILEV